MLNFIGYVFYGIAIADFLGMFFGYDFTGQVWTPYLFGAIGAGCQSLGKNQIVNSQGDMAPKLNDGFIDWGYLLDNAEVL